MPSLRKIQQHADLNALIARPITSSAQYSTSTFHLLVVNNARRKGIVGGDLVLVSFWPFAAVPERCLANIQAGADDTMSFS
ncbi:MAG: hypothetical protein AAFY56_07855 [Pseudomonadota bacterium]